MHEFTPVVHDVNIGPEFDECWSHNVSQHDFFLSYRVASEGKQVAGSKVCFFSLCLFCFIVFYLTKGTSIRGSSNDV